jgi:hypothetical protein
VPRADQALSQLDLPGLNPAARVSAAKSVSGAVKSIPDVGTLILANVDRSRWLPSHPPLLTASSLRKTPNAGQRFESG